MPRLIAALMRHGHYRQPESTPSAHLGYPLTETGRTQAGEAAAEVADLADARGWTLDGTVETSHLLRAWQTGTIIAERWAARYGRPFRVEEFPALAERSVGAAANLTESQIQSIVDEDPRHDLPPGWRVSSTIRLPFTAAESLMEAGARALAHLETRCAELSGRLESDTVRLFVGHGGAFRHAAIHMRILRVEDMPRFSMRNCGTIYLERIEGGSWIHVAGDWKVRDRDRSVD